MAYSNFTKQVVFADNKINILCNRIYDALENEFIKATLDTKFCITGTVSKIIQGAALSDVPVIAFITDDALIYKYCSNTLAKSLRAKAITFKDRIQMDYKGIYLEFWLTDNLGTIDEINGLYVQDTADIPANIK
tara:strand:- start:240 stop:641 length:402 start_codon:yes stop_codon:yes gene_type:complete